MLRRSRLLENGYEGELNDLFRQRGARKVREYFKLYYDYDYADATPEQMHTTLAPAEEGEATAPRTPPVAGFAKLK